MKALFHVFYSLTCLLVLTTIGLVVTKHLVVTAQRRMINVVDDNDHNKVLFQMPTETIDYVVNFTK
jgi:Tfp pilus assembly protein PilX